MASPTNSRARHPHAKRLVSRYRFIVIAATCKSNQHILHCCNTCISARGKSAKLKVCVVKTVCVAYRLCSVWLLLCIKLWAQKPFRFIFVYGICSPNAKENSLSSENSRKVWDMSNRMNPSGRHVVVYTVTMVTGIVSQVEFLLFLYRIVEHAERCSVQLMLCVYLHGLLLSYDFFSFFFPVNMNLNILWLWNFILNLDLRCSVHSFILYYLHVTISFISILNFVFLFVCDKG